MAWRGGGGNRRHPSEGTDLPGDKGGRAGCLFGRMLFRLVKNPPQIDQSLTIQMQCSDGGPSGGRYPNALGEALVPDKMIRPFLSSWVEKRHILIADWIVSFGFGVFVAVASLARERQILQFSPAAFVNGEDMLNGKGLH